MIEVRCKNCNRLLLKAVLLIGAIKCHSCKSIFEYQVYSNIHMTDQIDPEVLHKRNERAIKDTEPTEAITH